MCPPFMGGNAKVDELRKVIDEGQLCALLSADGLKFNVDECAGINGLVWYDANENGNKRKW